jgi:hypothetical protein
MATSTPTVGSGEWVETWVSAINDDSEIGRIGKYFEARMCVQFGDDRYILLIIGGRILSVLTNPIWDKPYDFKIAADVDTWERSAQRVPRPFYQDIFGMMWNHGMTVEGNVVKAMQNIRSVKMMLAAMKSVTASTD